MVRRTELISLHILDLLEMLETDPGVEGSLSLLVNGEERADVDLDDLCLVIRLEDTKSHSMANIIPMQRDELKTP